MFKLVIQDDEGKTTVVPLIRDEITIGRKEGNTIRLTERNVSRRHARIVRSNGEVQIEDLGSYNGIRVNNARIAEKVSLRVSDQVQIGDYKLYLKAEGVEQVDDARTMPIERVDSPIATEIMPAVASASPTQPLPATPAPTPAVGTPAARPAAVSGTADTDPGGRPVANAAQIAALNQTAAYGKLCVVSSNFAGKEYDLTRPQMIIGRTDENDIVINHRSISRNHAKITRDPETSRYTISDLQSSNGVRVNGQDYGKVELRRGDTIDLGHVRLRFIEPGEDFVFARDAVIADVAETGGRRGLLVAVVLGVLVLVGVGAFFFLNKKTDDDKKPGTGQLATGSDHLASGDNPGQGPGSQIAEAPADAIDNAVAPTGSDTVAPTDEAGQLRVECLNYQTEKKWQDMANCAKRLAAKDQAGGTQLAARAKAEQGNELQSGKVDEAIKQGDLLKAKKLVDKIDDDSVYKKQATTAYEGLLKQDVDQAKDKAARFAAAHRCAELEKYAQQQSSSLGPDVGEAVRQVRCEPIVASGDHGGSKPPNGGGSNTQSTPTPSCDADSLDEKARNDEAVGQHAAALANFEAAIRCKPTDRRYQLAFMSACNAANLGKAKLYYKKVTTNKSQLAQMCVRNGIKIEQLDAP